MKNITRLLTILALLALTLAACGGDNGDTSSNGDTGGATTGTTQSDSRFTITGGHELNANNVRVIAQSTDEEFNSVTENPVFRFVQLVEGSLSDPQATINLTLPGDLVSGTFPLLDSTEMSSEGTQHLAGYVRRVDQENTFYSLTEPGTLTLTVNGNNVSGSFEFTARLISADEDADTVRISGVFEAQF